MKLVCEKQKPIYSPNLTYLEITYYHSLLDKKIKGIIGSCQDPEQYINNLDPDLYKVTISFFRNSKMSLYNETSQQF